MRLFSYLVSAITALMFPSEGGLSSRKRSEVSGIVAPGMPDTNLDIPKRGPERVAYFEKLIDSDPFDAATYQAESGRNPLAKNKTSSASGAFQLINKTAQNLGVKDPLDIAQNYAGFQKLKAENQAVIEKLGMDPNDPQLLYSTHYLGSPVFKKLILCTKLTSQEAEQVRYLKRKALPDFMKIYAQVLSKTKGVTEV